MTQEYSDDWTQRQRDRSARRSLAGPLQRYYGSLKQGLEAGAASFFDRVMQVHNGRAPRKAKIEIEGVGECPLRLCRLALIRRSLCCYSPNVEGNRVIVCPSLLRYRASLRMDTDLPVQLTADPSFVSVGFGRDTLLNCDSKRRGDRNSRKG